MGKPSGRVRRQVVARLVVWPSHEALTDTTAGRREQRVRLDAAPIAVVTPMEAIMHGWWLRSAAYPVGRVFATAMPR